MQRAIGRKPRENAWVEVNNLLASVDEIREVRPEQVARIAERYRMPLRGEFVGRLERLYRDYLVYCLADARLSAEELCDLAHLKRILRLTDRALAEIHESVAKQVYALTVDAVLADGRIDPAERAFLDTLQQHLAISGKVVDRIMLARRRRREDEAAL
jgi:uncharacterized membrane protein YebE (DUF533 family)